MSGDDLRASRTVGSTTTTYLWDQLTALPTIAGDGTAHYVHGPSGLLNESTGTTPSYPLQDALGSIRARTNASGTVTAMDSWDVWGNPRTTPSGNLFGWTGEPRDATTNLVYLRARDYSAGTGRFSSRDTVNPNGPGTQGYNPYAYASGNPTTFTDPSGHFAQSMAITGTATFASSAVLYTFLTAAWAGIAPLLLIIGAFVVAVLVIIALVLLAMAIYGELQQACASHGMAVGECLGAGVSGTAEFGVDIGTLAASFAFAAAVAPACAAVSSLQRSSTGRGLFFSCPKLPKPERNDDCEQLGDDLPSIDDGGGLPPIPGDDDDDDDPAGGVGSGVTGGLPAAPPNNPVMPTYGKPPADGGN